MENRVYENEFARVWFEDGIMCCAYKKQHLDLDIAKECVKIRLEAAGESDYLTFIDATNLKSVTKEARDYFGSDEGILHVRATAFLTNSIVGKFMVNFFLQISRPKIPTRLFNDRADAIKWLWQFEKAKV